ncbi:alpha-galactosidase [Halobacillus sp. BBL2006]|uniref:alpha-galactosidase n=1 Tax=Halobacillus sp. BBL2006 TaxID=1543706 RepID=UPI000541C250|nr:alpha-galactosidase [Halobacillus sp. BBL2006]KHE70341.1 alpha-galactosidase [Halobacillus sp. BBL2006]
MPIFINEENMQFHLQGKNVSYVFHVMKNRQLGHLYIGNKLRNREDFSHLSKVEHRVASSYVYEEDPSFSLDLLKQEYPSYGTSDYREPAFQLLQPNGSRISDFTYRAHEVVEGKPALDGLPATYTESGTEAETLVIHLHDDVTEVSLELMYTVFHERNVVTRTSRFINRGEETHQLQRALSTSVDLPDADYSLVQLSGSWSRERHIQERRLQQGIQSITSTRGTSSSQHNPFLALKRPETTEHQGEVFGFSLIYSGNFLAQVEVDHYENARISMGINPFDFSWTMEPGETFQTPEAVIAFSNEGMNGLSQSFHDLYQKRLARGQWRDRERPVLINNWEATYFDFNEEKLLSIADRANELGIELFVLDDGWFGKRNDDTTSLGDWFVDESKLPNGLAPLVEQMNEKGMMFGLWFEPEMISRESKLYEQHSEWIIHVPERHPSTGRHQLVLDFSNPEVVDYIYERMSAILSEAKIDYVKWDMNRYMTEIGSIAHASERQMEVPHRYILGVYRLYERLLESFPHVLFESCASGGARFDPGMLYYAPQGWTSDDTDAVERLSIQYGTSMVYPLSSMGAHISAVPNHQVKRMTSLKTRGDVAYFGAFGYELDVTEMTKEEQRQVKEQVSWYKSHRGLFQYGQFYRLISPFQGDRNETSWMVVSADRKKAIVGVYQILARPNPGFNRIRLKGLDPEDEYKIEGQAGTYFGDELMHAGIQLESAYNGAQTGGIEESGDFSSQLFVLSSVNES